MYTLDIVFESYKIYNEILSYRKTASTLKDKYKCSITRQIIMIWIKNINTNMKKFINKRALKLDNTNNKINDTSNNSDLKIINDINLLVSNNPFITRQMIINTINDKYKTKLTLNNVSKIFKRLNLTRKKPKYSHKTKFSFQKFCFWCYRKWNKFPDFSGNLILWLYHVVKSLEYLDELIIKRQKFKNDISKIDFNKIISIDESAFNNLNNNNKGLSKKGKSINMPCNEKRVKNNSLICAISIDKIIHYEIHETSINSDIFYNFIYNLIKNNNLKNYYFMIDNVRFHHCKKTLKLITDTNNNYIFTPPYSPNNNPIEVVFSIIKNKFKKMKKENIIIKPLIIISINKVKENEKEKSYKEIFIRSINYDYKDIEKELRDRLIIKN